MSVQDIRLKNLTKTERHVAKIIKKHGPMEWFDIELPFLSIEKQRDIVMSIGYRFSIIFECKLDHDENTATFARTSRKKTIKDMVLNAVRYKSSLASIKCKLEHVPVDLLLNEIDSLIEKGVLIEVGKTRYGSPIYENTRW